MCNTSENIEEYSKCSTCKVRLNSFIELKNLAETNSTSFFPLFQEIYPDFYNKIIELDPNISYSECVFLAYLRLNFSTKEIARYTFVTIKAIQMKKRRVRKKYQIPPDQDLYLWINQIHEHKPNSKENT